MKVTQNKLNFHRKESEHAVGMAVIKGQLSQLTTHLSLLHPEERKKFEGFKFDKRRHSYLLGRLTAKKALEAVNPATSSDQVFIDEGVFQFPVCRHQQGPYFQLSISHCDEVGMALAYPEAHPVGIDIEKINAKSLEALEGQFSDKEKQMLQSQQLDPLAGLTMLWTAKEALSKIFRTGMMMDFRIFELSKIEQQGNFFLSEYKNCGQYKAISIIHESHACTITVPGRSEFDEESFVKNVISTIAK